jgi:hypothetical protein
MTAVFYQSEEQRRLALATRDQTAAQRKQKVLTPALPLGDFYLAEDYHQKYWLRGRKELLKEFQAIYPSEKDFLSSTAVMRVNAYLGGEGTFASLEREIDSFGLTPAGKKMLLEHVKARR